MGLQNPLALGGAVHTHSHGFRMERRSIPPEAEATVAAAEVSHSTLEPPLACTPATAASDSIALGKSLCVTARGVIALTHGTRLLHDTALRRRLVLSDQWQLTTRCGHLK